LYVVLTIILYVCNASKLFIVNALFVIVNGSLNVRVDPFKFTLVRFVIFVPLIKLSLVPCLYIENMNSSELAYPLDEKYASSDVTPVGVENENLKVCAPPIKSPVPLG
jgi:hypothetical protein